MAISKEDFEIIALELHKVRYKIKGITAFGKGYDRGFEFAIAVVCQGFMRCNERFDYDKFMEKVNNG